MNTTTTSSYDEIGKIELGTLLAMPTKPEHHLWNPFLPKQGLAALAGPPDSGKSMLARHLALAVALGQQEFLGYPLAPEHRKVLYVSTEDSLPQVKVAFEHQLLHYAPNATEDLYNLSILPADTLSPQEMLGKLEEIMASEKFDLVIVDSFGDAFTGKDGNNNAEVRTALRPYNKLASEHECLVLFVSHINKAGY